MNNMANKRKSALLSTRHTKRAKLPLFSRWNELPAEIWAKTFLYLPEWLRPLVSITCQRWYSVIKLLSVKRLTCKAAAEGGHLEVLQWAREHGCPWDEKTCYWAAYLGHLKILQWAREHDCPWDENICARTAARKGHLHVQQWLWEYC